MEKSHRLFGLDLLRAAAVLGVVVSHGFNLITPSGRALVEKFLFMPAYFGVELFFVLSGFLIGSILLKEKHTQSFGALLQFWIRRWFRTLPNYYFIMFISLMSVFLLGQTKQLHPRDWLDLLFLQNFAWAHSEFFGRSWSLAIEEWFYLLFPLGIFFLRKWRIPFTQVFILVTVLFIFGPMLARGLALKLRPDLFWAAHYWKIVVFRLDAVMFGVFGAYLRQTFPLAWDRWRYAFLLFSGIIIAGVLGCFAGWIPLSKASFCLLICPLTSLGFACCLPFFAHFQDGGEGVLARLITNTALYSYSIYLLHPLIFEGLERISGLYSPSNILRYGLLVVLILASYLVSKANYYCFEKPMMDLRE